MISFPELLRRCEKKYAASYRDLNRGGLTRHQFGVLSVLRDHPNADQTELVALTGFDRSTLSAMLATLESQHLIRRARHIGDARANALDITVDGRVAIKRAAAVAARAEKNTLAALTVADRARFVALLADVAGVSHA